LEVREMGRIRWVGIGVFLALLVIGLSRSAFAKGPPDKVIVQGPGLSGEVEITDPRRLQAFGFFQFEDISQRVDPPSDPGPGYVITRYVYVITRYVRDPARGWIAWNRLIYYPPRGGRPGVVWAEGLSVTTNYDGFWYAVSAEGERVMEEILHEMPSIGTLTPTAPAPATAVPPLPMPLSPTPRPTEPLDGELLGPTGGSGESSRSVPTAIVLGIAGGLLILGLRSRSWARR
jgi:hypothetical protein